MERGLATSADKDEVSVMKSKGTREMIGGYGEGQAVKVREERGAESLSREGTAEYKNLEKEELRVIIRSNKWPCR